MAVSSRPGVSRLLVIGLIVLSLATITVDFRSGEEGPLAAIGRTALAIISPLQEGLSKVIRPVGDFISNLTSAQRIQAENEELHQQLEELVGGQARTLELVRENEQLRSLLELRDQLGFTTMGATVIGESPTNFEWAVFIDRGASGGVELDMPAMGPEGLVGRVVKASGGSSKVMLIIDPDSAVAVRLSSTGERGILVGQRERDLRLDLIDPQTTVVPGEQVVTSGYGGIFPADIPVGVVSRVTPDPSGLTQHVFVRPNVDFSALDFILLVLANRDVQE
ncbi:MAG: rod shape-determining protein MreC [Actinomycetota bacterium]